MLRTLVVLLSASAVASAGAPDRILKRDNGKLVGKQSMAASGHALGFFVPPGKWFVRSVLIHGSRYGGKKHPFPVFVCTPKLRTLTNGQGTCGSFREGLFTWVEVPVKPVPVRGKFKVIVDFRPTRDHGVYVAYCNASKSHSSYARPGGVERRFAKGKEWMIRVRLSSSAARLPDAGARTRDAIRTRRGRATPIVWDPARKGKPYSLDWGAPLDTLDEKQEPYLLQWGVIFVTTRRLVATEQHAPADIRTMPLFDGLHHRRIDLVAGNRAVRASVEEVARWFEAKVDWKPEGNGRRLTMRVSGVLGRDALDLLLVPCGFTWRISGDRIVVTSK